jgi:hypothetical protein
MKFADTYNQLKRLIDDNSPVILTGMAVSGTLLSVYYTYKGAVKGVRRIDHAEIQKRGPETDEINLDSSLTNAEKFLLTYKFYAPAAVAVVGTSTCMIMATKIGLNRTAAVAGLLAVAERTHEQYSDKVKEILGDTKHVKVVDAVATDQVQNSSTAGLLPLADGNQEFFDLWTGRSLATTREKLEKAVNKFNHELIYGSHASLNEFYDKIGLEEIQQGDDIGFNVDHLLELHFTAVEKNERAVMAFEFNKAPKLGFRPGGS